MRCVRAQPILGTTRKSGQYGSPVISEEWSVDHLNGPEGVKGMPMSERAALVGSQPFTTAGPRSWPRARRFRSIAEQLQAVMWGDGRLRLPAPVASGPEPVSSADGRRAETVRLAGPVAGDSHHALVPPAARVDKHTAAAHYRAMAEQVARERRVTAPARRQVSGGRS